MADRFDFGIYAGSAVGDGPALLKGHPDSSEMIQSALDRLQGNCQHFYVRCYVHYIGAGKSANSTPFYPEEFAVIGRKLDYVICHQTNEPDLDGWLEFIDKIIMESGNFIGRLQITQEINVKGHGQDGDFINSTEALVVGLIAANRTCKRLGLKIQIGFNIAPSFTVDNFWENFQSLIGPEFIAGVNYVGLDFFPDVFRPIPLDSLENALVFLLQGFREKARYLGLSDEVFFVVTENGWPTSKLRTYERQCVILEHIVKIIFKYREQFNVQGYQYFSLRDASTDNPDQYLNNEFGLMDDKYFPKPAFETYRSLIEQYYFDV